MQSMGVIASTMTPQHHTGWENLYRCEVTVYRFQLDKELHSVNMNILKVRYTSKAHFVTIQIVSECDSPVQSLKNAPKGALSSKFVL
jgi:hypothetical protein